MHSNIAVSDDSKKKLEQMLRLADMVKFAKGASPCRSRTNFGSFNNALDYVKGTILEMKIEGNESVS